MVGGSVDYHTGKGDVNDVSRGEERVEGTRVLSVKVGVGTCPRLFFFFVFLGPC